MPDSTNNTLTVSLTVGFDPSIPSRVIEELKRELQNKLQQAQTDILKFRREDEVVVYTKSRLTAA